MLREILIDGVRIAVAIGLVLVCISLALGHLAG